jgi:hypothetical protein
MAAVAGTRAIAGGCIPTALIARASSPLVTSGGSAGRASPPRNAQVRGAMQVAELANHVPIAGVFQDPPQTLGESLSATSTYPRSGNAVPNISGVLGLPRRASADLRTLSPNASRVGPARPRPYPLK